MADKYGSKWLRQREDAERTHQHAEDFAKQAVVYLLRAALLAGALPLLVARAVYFRPWVGEASTLELLPDLAQAVAVEAARELLVAAPAVLAECHRRQHEPNAERARKAERLRWVGEACVAAAKAMNVAKRVIIWRKGEPAQVFEVVRAGKTFVVVRALHATPGSPTERVEKTRKWSGGWPDGMEVHFLGDAPVLKPVRGEK